MTPEQFNRLIIDSVPGGVVQLNAEGKILRANAEAQRILGVAYDEITQMYASSFDTQTLWEDGSPCPVTAYPAVRALMTGARQGPDTIGIRRPDGEVSWAVFNAVPILEDGSVVGAIATFLDITQRKEAEAERDRLRGRLLQTDRLASIGTLAASVAHDINNPLTYVMGSLEQLKECLDQDDAEAKHELLDHAVEGADRVRQVVNDLLLFSKTRAQQAKPVDVVKAVQSSVRIASNELKYRAKLVMDLDPVSPVFGQAARLGQVVLNLVLNAAASIPEGHYDDHEVRISTSMVDPWVEIKVSDSGGGVPDHLMERVFEPFVTTKAPDRGTGLGLFICKGIVEDLGGKISLASEVGRGTIVTVRLPAARPTHSAAKQDAPELVGNRILLIDDEDMIRKVLRSVLKGNEVIDVECGNAAIELLQDDRNFDLILCDLIMRRGTGMDVHTWVKGNAPQLLERMLFMTGAAFTEGTRRFLASGGPVVIRKPFAGTLLKRKLAELLKGKTPITP